MEAPWVSRREKNEGEGAVLPNQQIINTLGSFRAQHANALRITGSFCTAASSQPHSGCTCARPWTEASLHHSQTDQKTWRKNWKCRCWRGEFLVWLHCSVSGFGGSEGFSLWRLFLRKHHITQLLAHVCDSLCNTQDNRRSLNYRL